MAIDLFNNPSNDYIYPGLAPCPGAADDQYLTWTENGLAIIKGSQIVSEIGFNDLQTPVNSFSKQQVTLESGEVTFIPGLTKGLCNKNIGFLLPALNSSDLSLNPFFFELDFSINFYKNFSFTTLSIDVSADYEQNIDIEDAINIKFDSLGIKILSSYDPSILCFTGTTPGYEFYVTNMVLHIYDSSGTGAVHYSPFAYGANAEYYDLEEDPSAFIPAMKYPNTAMQGLALKGIYPSDQAECDKWVYLHHVTDYVITYDPIEVNYDSEVSTNLYISYPYIGTPPDGIDYAYTSELFNVLIDASDSIIDVSIASSNIINSINFENSNIRDCSIQVCSLGPNYILNTEFEECSLDGTSDYLYLSGSIVNNDSVLLNAIMVNSWINVFKLLVNPSVGYIYVTDDVSFNNVVVSGGEIWDSSINCAEISDASLYNCWIEDSSLYNCTTYNCTFGPRTLDVNTRDIMIDPSIQCEYDVIQDTSTFFLRHRRKVELGMSGCSVEDLMSAGDYLNLVTVNGWWKKVGEVYIWISAPDCDGDCVNKNLIDGFYVYNPHEFTVQIEYMVIV